MSALPQQFSSLSPGRGSGEKDPTFRNYNAAQAAAYAKSRSGYSDALYQYVLSHHDSTGGQRRMLLDVGCGPGNASRDLAAFFDHALGCDPGAEMIKQARMPGYKTRISEKVRFEICPAEELDTLESVPRGSVDLVTCAMSAHWFELNKFYPAAARVLKPGGTLALWTCGSFYVHPSTPNATDVQRLLDELQLETLAPYRTRGNELCYNIYDDLDLPWTLRPPTCDKEFVEDGLHRKSWNRDGEVSEDEGGGFIEGGSAASLAETQIALGTASMVTRWREARKEQLESGAIRDCVEETFARIREAIGIEKGEEHKAMLQTGMATGLLMMKRL